MTTSLVALSAGLRQPSSTRLLADRLLHATTDSLTEAQHAVDGQVIDLRNHAHDIVDMMLTGFASPQLQTTLDQVSQADGLIVVTPLYQESISGLAKSFFDILERDAIASIPTLLGATGGTARHSAVVDYAVRPILTYLRADVLPTTVMAATEDWAGQGDSVRPLTERITRAGAELAGRVSQPARIAAPKPAHSFDEVPDMAAMLASLGSSGVRSGS